MATVLRLSSEYNDYVKSAPPTNQYVATAKARIAALTKNVMATQKIPTQSEIKSGQEAQTAYEQAIKLQQDGKFDDALPLYQKACAAVPTESAYWYALGTCYQAQERSGQRDGQLQEGARPAA